LSPIQGGRVKEVVIEGEGGEEEEGWITKEGEECKTDGMKMKKWKKMMRKDA